MGVVVTEHIAKNKTIAVNGLVNESIEDSPILWITVMMR